MSRQGASYSPAAAPLTRVVHANQIGLRLGERDGVVQHRVLGSPVLHVAHARVVRRDRPVGGSVEVAQQIREVGAAELDARRRVGQVGGAVGSTVHEPERHHILRGLGHELHEPLRAPVGDRLRIPAGLRADNRGNQIGIDPVPRGRIGDLLLVLQRIDALEEHRRAKGVHRGDDPHHQHDRHRHHPKPREQSPATYGPPPPPASGRLPRREPRRPPCPLPDREPHPARRPDRPRAQPDTRRARRRASRRRPRCR